MRPRMHLPRLGGTVGGTVMWIGANPGTTTGDGYLARRPVVARGTCAEQLCPLSGIILPEAPCCGDPGRITEQQGVRPMHAVLLV